MAAGSRSKLVILEPFDLFFLLEYDSDRKQRVGITPESALRLSACRCLLLVGRGRLLGCIQPKVDVTSVEGT